MDHLGRGSVTRRFQIWHCQIVLIPDPYYLKSVQMVCRVSDDLDNVPMISKMSRSSIKWTLLLKYIFFQIIIQLLSFLVLVLKLLFYALLSPTWKCRDLPTLSRKFLRPKSRFPESFRFFRLCHPCHIHLNILTLVRPPFPFWQCQDFESAWSKPLPYIEFILEVDG